MSAQGILAVCGLSLAAAMPAAALEPARLTGHPHWPPFSFQSGDKLVGIGPELAAIVFKDAGLNVISAPSGNWKRAQAQVEFGAADVLVAAYRTDERLRFLAYPRTPFMEDVNVVWVSKGKEFTFRRWDDLIGKNGTAMLGESYGQGFDQHIRSKLKMEWVSTPAQALQKLALGRADYYPFSLHGGMVQVREFGFSGRITHLATPIASENVYIAISRKSPYLQYLPRIEAAIAARRADGTVDRLIRKHAP